MPRAQFVREFGLKAFRRPLRTEGVDALRQAFHRASQDFMSGRAAGGGSDAAIAELSVSRGARRRTAKPYEIASRLSYFLWDTMPDAALFRAAAAQAS